MEHNYYLLYQHRETEEDLVLLLASAGESHRRIVRELGCFELINAIALHVALYETYSIMADKEYYTVGELRTMYPGCKLVALDPDELKQGALPTYRRRPMQVYLCENTEPGMVDYELMFTDGHKWWEIDPPQDIQQMSVSDAVKTMHREFAFTRDVYRLFQGYAHREFELEFAAGYTPEKWQELDGCVMHRIAEEWH